MFEEKDDASAVENLIFEFFNELNQDCSYILDINALHDDKEFKQVELQDLQFDDINNITSYLKNETLYWKYEMLREVLGAYNEPLLNLHFLGPYLKNNCSSFNTYECIFNLFAIIPPKSRTNVVEKITNRIKEAK